MATAHTSGGGRNDEVGINNALGLNSRRAKTSLITMTQSLASHSTHFKHASHLQHASHLLTGMKVNPNTAAIHCSTATSMAPEEVAPEEGLVAE